MVSLTKRLDKATQQLDDTKAKLTISEESTRDLQKENTQLREQVKSLMAGDGIEATRQQSAAPDAHAAPGDAGHHGVQSSVHAALRQRGTYSITDGAVDPTKSKKSKKRSKKGKRDADANGVPKEVVEMTRQLRVANKHLEDSLLASEEEVSELRLALALRGDDPSVAKPRQHVKTLEERLKSVEQDIREETRIRKEMLAAADSAVQKLGRLLVFKNVGKVCGLAFAYHVSQCLLCVLIADQAPDTDTDFDTASGVSFPMLRRRVSSPRNTAPGAGRSPRQQQQHASPRQSRPHHQQYHATAQSSGNKSASLRDPNSIRHVTRRVGDGVPKRVHMEGHPTAAEVAARHSNRHPRHHGSVPPSALLVTNTDIFEQAGLSGSSTQQRSGHGSRNVRGRSRSPRGKAGAAAAMSPESAAAAQMSETERRIRELRRVIWMGGRKIGEQYLLVTVYRLPDAAHSTDLFAEAYDSATYTKYEASCNSSWLVGTDTHLLQKERGEDLSLLMAERLVVASSDRKSQKSSSSMGVPPSDAVLLRKTGQPGKPKHQDNEGGGDLPLATELRPNIVVFAVKKVDQGSSYCWEVVGLDASSSRQYRLVVTPAAAYDLLGRDVNRNIGSRVENAKKLLQAMIKNIYPAAARRALRASQALNMKDITVVARKFGASACLVSALKLGDEAAATVSYWLEGYDLTRQKLVAGLKLSKSDIASAGLRGVATEQLLVRLPLFLSNSAFWLPDADDDDDEVDEDDEVAALAAAHGVRGPGSDMVGGDTGTRVDTPNTMATAQRSASRAHTLRTQGSRTTIGSRAESYKKMRSTAAANAVTHKAKPRVLDEQSLKKSSSLKNVPLRPEASTTDDDRASRPEKRRGSGRSRSRSRRRDDDDRSHRSHRSRSRRRDDDNESYTGSRVSKSSRRSRSRHHRRRSSRSHDSGSHRSRDRDDQSPRRSARRSRRDHGDSDTHSHHSRRHRHRRTNSGSGRAMDRVNSAGSFNSGVSGAQGAYSVRSGSTRGGHNVTGYVVPSVVTAASAAHGQPSLSHADSGTSFGSRHLSGHHMAGSGAGGHTATPSLGQTRSVNTIHTQR